MASNKKRVALKKGIVFQVPLSDGSFGYGQIVEKARKNFFNFRNNGEIPNLNTLVNLPVLFQISVYDYIFKEGIWPIIGKADVNEQNIDFVKGHFTYDKDKGCYLLWEQNGKRIVEPDQLKDCEYVSVWDYQSAQQRLLDALDRRPNYWVEQDKNMHNPDFLDIVNFYKLYGYEFKLPDSFKD
ncbi:immunity 26/phosphotriesterase HocA family protein [Candidatus Odyssella thessalonicensis]|uniref:immunity 26/phosphotriesterase HocA family protein n=1 Tax=Candidatus Odyssella thessalonicensis TaxID=84647 RepID=UPI000225B23A|nr:immunity 26/phosphotriesterase HocA family protein [Candidatus Odyssella thessalonicensis]